MSFSFNLDPLEGDEGVEAPVTIRLNRPADSSLSPVLRKSSSAPVQRDVKKPSTTTQEEEVEEDEDADRGGQQRQRRHGEAKKGGAGRRRAAKPLSESGSLKSTGPPQAVKMVVHTPPISPRNDAAAQTWAAPLNKTARSGTTPKLVRMYTGKQNKVKGRSSTALSFADMRKRLLGGGEPEEPGGGRGSGGLFKAFGRGGSKGQGSADFWGQLKQQDDGKTTKAAASATAGPCRMLSSTGRSFSMKQCKPAEGTRRRSQAAELMDDVTAALDVGMQRTLEANVTVRPTRAGHLDDNPLQHRPRQLSVVAAGTGEVNMLSSTGTLRPVGDAAAKLSSTPVVAIDPAGADAAPAEKARQTRQERRRSLKRKSDAGVDPELQMTSGASLADRRSSTDGRRSSSSNTGPQTDVQEGEAKSEKEEEEGEEEEEEEEPNLLFTLEEWIDDRNPGLGRQVVEEEWSPNHAKLLYLISKFAVCARTADDAESWIRNLPLIILLYEGIVAGCLDFDYAPASTLVSMDGKSRRVWLNVTQEGKAAIDDLREGKLVNGLKLSTVDFQPVTAYQVSLRGLKALEQVPDRLKAMVDSFVHTPVDHRNITPHELLHVRYKSLEELQELRPWMDKYDTYADEEEIEEDEDTEGFFVLMGEKSNYIRRSSITSSEDVSYVSSPYLPTCIRNVRRMKRLTSNKHRAHESAGGASNIKDDLNEAIILSNVHAIVGEWIPFGANQIVALNERLGSMDRCQGGMFSSLIDKYPCDLSFESEPGLTQVKILDYDPVRFINFEAEIHFPEADGIVQVENFGLHINVDGSVMYGIYVEAIMHRKDDDISLDLLSRMLVDVHQDSSKIMNDLLSKYQKALMDMIFMGDTDHRAKFNMIIADGIEPFLYCEEYMDREDNENELKQVIGDLYNVFDVGEHGVLMLGRDGMIFAGSSASAFEQVLVSYLSMLVREMFIRVFFIRTFVLDDLLKQTRQLVVTYESNPNNIAEIRSRLNDASRDIISLEALLEYLKESLENLKIPPPPRDKDGCLVSAALFKSLAIEARQKDVMNRVIDLRKLIHGARSEMHILQKMRDVINSKKLEDVYKDVEGNTKYLVDASAANERASASLEVMQVVLGGTLGFSIIDRLAGGTMNMDQPDWVNKTVVAYVIDYPYLWFCLNMLWFAIVSVGLFKFMRYLAHKSEGALTIRRKVNRRLRLPRFKAYLSSKKLEMLDSLQDAKTRVKKASWQETDEQLWQGEPPKVDVQYDERYGFLLVVVLRVNARNTRLREHQIMSRFLTVLQDEGVLLTPEEEERAAREEQQEGEEEAEEQQAAGAATLKKAL